MSYEKHLGLRPRPRPGLPGAFYLTLLPACVIFWAAGTAWGQLRPFDYKGDTERVPGEITLTLEAGKYEIKDAGDGEEIIVMEDFGATTSAGDPMLPHNVYDVVVPPNIDWDTVALELEPKAYSLPGEHAVKPAPPLRAWVDDEELVDWGEDKKIVDGRNVNVYGVDSFFPEETVKEVSRSQMRKWKFLRLAFAPVQYNPVTGELRLVESVRVRVVFNRIGTKAFRTDPTLRDAVMDDEAERRFVNFDEARDWYRPAPESGSREGPGEDERKADYVIITTTEIVRGSGDGLINFVNHKKSLGYKVKVVTENDYGPLTGQAPNGTAEKIRQWLVNNYVALGVKWVLLVGNPDPDDPADAADTVGDVPMKMCWPRRGATWHPTHDESPTDHFYASLSNTDWDLDGDGFFGENPDDSGPGGVDFTADVYVGRIPVYGADYAALNYILYKTIFYESVTSMPGWRRRALLPMKPSDDSTPGYDLGENVKNGCLVPKGFGYCRIYEQNYGLVPPPDVTPCTATCVAGEWPQGYGLVTWWTHGGPTSASGIFSTVSCAALNDARPSFTFQASCLNGYPEVTGNLGYALLRHGAVGTVSASRVSWYWPGIHPPNPTSGVNQHLAYYYSRYLVKDEMAAGRALFETKNPSGFWMNNMDYNLYGDPSTNLFRVERPGRGRRWVSGHVGYAVPVTAFADYFDPGFNVLLDVGYRFTPRLGLVGLFGYNAFSSKVATLSDTYWFNINANLRFYQPISGPWSAYAGAGPGYYIPKAGNNKFGFNAGPGVNFDLSSLITLEAGADYHMIVDGLKVYDPTYTDDAAFVHIHVGVLVSF